jgi:hypothetical protein
VNGDRNEETVLEYRRERELACDTHTTENREPHFFSERGRQRGKPCELQGGTFFQNGRNIECAGHLENMHERTLRLASLKEDPAKFGIFSGFEPMDFRSDRRPRIGTVQDEHGTRMRFETAPTGEVLIHEIDVAIVPSLNEGKYAQRLLTQFCNWADYHGVPAINLNSSTTLRNDRIPFANNGISIKEADRTTSIGFYILGPSFFEENLDKNTDNEPEIHFLRNHLYGLTGSNRWYHGFSFNENVHPERTLTRKHREDCVAKYHPGDGSARIEGRFGVFKRYRPRDFVAHRLHAVKDERWGVTFWVQGTETASAVFLHSLYLHDPPLINSRSGFEKIEHLIKNAFSWAEHHVIALTFDPDIHLHGISRLEKLRDSDSLEQKYALYRDRLASISHDYRLVPTNLGEKNHAQSFNLENVSLQKDPSSNDQPHADPTGLDERSKPEEKQTEHRRFRRH